jgi:hypothetical protein
MQRNAKLGAQPDIIYESFLLRIRRTSRPGGVCRAMLVNVCTREQRYFGSLDDLLRYLDDAAAAPGDSQPRKACLL